MKKQPLIKKLHTPVHPKVGMIVLSIAVVLAILGLLIIWQQQKVSSISQQLPQAVTNYVSTAPTPLPTAYPTTNIVSPWLTYTNNDVGFSIQYPANWTKQDFVSDGKVVGGAVSGKEGIIQVHSGSFGGGGCIAGAPSNNGRVTGVIKGIDTLNIHGDILNGCHNVFSDDSEGWGDLFNSNPHVSIGVNVNTPSEINRKLILQVLSTLTFIKS